MTVSTVNSNTRTSRVSKNPRPVEDIVIEKQSVVLPKEEQAIVDQQIIKAKHEIVRTLVKLLFSCKTQEGVDAVWQKALLQNDAFMYEHGVEVKFELLINNAQYQIRRMINENVPFQTWNPEKVYIKMETKEVKAIVSSWGHLADKLTKGYKLSILK